MIRRLAAVALLTLAPAVAHASPASGVPVVNLAAAAGPVPFCGSQAPPLLYTIRSSQHLSLPDAIPTTSLFIQQGGFAVAVRSPRLVGRDLPIDTFVAIGEGDPAAYRRLVAALAAVRVGFQGNCFKLPLDANSIFEDTRITWYGQGRRHNTFVVTTRSNSGLPACPPAMDDLIEELDDYAVHLRNPQELPVVLPP